MRSLLNKARAKIRPRETARWRRHPRVLLVEPDHVVAISCQIFLLACGFLTKSVQTVKGALALLEKQPFDIVVSEWRLFTDGTGLDIIAAVRANPRLQRTKLIFLTVARDEAARIQSTAPDAVLYKPERPLVLIHTLRRLLRQRLSKS